MAGSGRRPRETQRSHVPEPREMSCPVFRAIKTPPARKWAHRSHTGAEGIKIYWGFETVLLIGSLGARPGSPPAFGRILTGGGGHVARDPTTSRQRHSSRTASRG